MTVTSPRVCVLGTVVSLDVLDILNHEVRVEVGGVISLVVCGVFVAQDAAHEEDFSLGVWNGHYGWAGKGNRGRDMDEIKT